VRSGTPHDAWCSADARALAAPTRRHITLPLRAAAPEGAAFDLGAPLSLEADAASEARRAASDAAPTLAARFAGAGDADGAGADLALWTLEYGDLCDEARALGIPQRALPLLPQPATAEGAKAAHRLLSLIIASRLSSNL
jgi:hypothetical protein